MRLIREISAFFPAYNEESNIKNTVISAYKILSKIAEKFEIIIIDDGSVDKTFEIVKKLSFRYKNIRVIIHKKNEGYGASLISGFYNSRYKWITFTDSDGQFDFSEITKLINTQKKTKADIIVGYYMKRKVSFIRKINTFLWQFLVKLFFGLSIRDIDCGFKLLRKSVIEEITTLESKRGAFISTELLVKCKLNDFKIVEVPVHHYPRKHGKPTGANVYVIISSFRDLFRLWKKLKQIA